MAEIRYLHDGQTLRLFSSSDEALGVRGAMATIRFGGGYLAEMADGNFLDAAGYLGRALSESVRATVNANEATERTSCDL